jgi:alanine racemase
MPRPIRAVVRASALRHNLQAAREAAGEARIWAVVKANAYGHGLERAARALADADGFALLDFQEAVRLRLAGVTKPILMLEGFFRPLDVNLLFKYRLTPVIHNPDQVELLKHMDFPAELDLYLKVNSGMNRLGFGVDEVRVVYNALRLHPRVGSITLMTHFANAEGPGGVKSWCAASRRRARSPTPRRCSGSRRRARAGCAPGSCSTAARRFPTGAPRRSGCSRP